MSGRVVAHEACAHYRSVRVDDPLPRRLLRNHVVLGVGDRPPAPVGAKDRSSARDAGLGQSRRPQAGFLDAAVEWRTTSTSPSQPSLSKSSPGAHFTARFTAGVRLDEVRQRWHQRCRIVSAATARSPCGVCQHDGLACRRAECVGPQQRCARHIALWPSPGERNRCRCRSRDAQLRSRHAVRPPMEHVTSWTSRPIRRCARCAATTPGVACCIASSVNNHCSLPGSLAAALRRSRTVSHERRHVITETRTRPADVGQTRTRGQFRADPPRPRPATPESPPR